MESQLIVRIDSKVKDKFRSAVRIEGKTASEKVREMVEEYVREHSMEEGMKSLWDEIGQSLKKKGYKESDVKKMIRKVRTGK
jgi:hypothetical protein